MRNKFLVIYGPTGVGKTDLSNSIAQAIPVEIINMDVGQFYTPFTIGTAKPLDWQTDQIKHHMFDILSEPKNLTVVEYRTRVKKLMHEIWQRGKLPVLVGGSGFYLRSLIFPLLSCNVTVDVPEKNKKEESWEALYEIDPGRALEIDRYDTYRIVRALHIWKKTDVIPSEYKPVYDPIADYKIVFLTRDRQELYHRINKRVEMMLECGWLREIREIISTKWEQFILEKKLIGYNELVVFWHEGSPQEKIANVVEKIKQRTRHYAKRQLTFWRMLEQQIISEDCNKKNDLHCLDLTTVENDGNNATLNHPLIVTLINNVKAWSKKKDSV